MPFISKSSNMYFLQSPKNDKKIPIFPRINFASYKKGKKDKKQQIPYESIAFQHYTVPYQEQMSFHDNKSDIKPIAYYLPQFHQIPENDVWWGEGFTEWTNTTVATPKFPGHYQPREPHEDIGYYTLDNVETIKKQVELAKHHGIYGFCIYYYWFSGKRLLEKPLDILFENKDIDMPYCLCWANENWTRRWDGKQNDVLIKQDEKPEDNIKIIKDLHKYLQDPRYIKRDGKPVILVYRYDHLPNFIETCQIWRKYCRENGIGEIHISVCNTSQKNLNHIIHEVDSVTQFPPHLYKTTSDIYDLNTQCKIYDASGKQSAEKMVEDLKISERKFTPAVMMGWDNHARKAKEASSFMNFSTLLFYQDLRDRIDFVRKNYKEDDRFIFINAWNEWAEGTYLEPDQRSGYALINTLSRAINDIHPHADPSYKPLDIPEEYEPKKIKKTAICLTIGYASYINNCLQKLNDISFEFDLFIFSNTIQTLDDIKIIMENNKHFKGDVFYIQDKYEHTLATIFKQFYINKQKEYENICVINATHHFPEAYDYVLDHLFPEKEKLNTMISYLQDENNNISLLFPIEYYQTFTQVNQMQSNIYSKIERIIKDTSITYEKHERKDDIPIPAFWMNSSLFEKIIAITKKHHPNMESDSVFYKALLKVLCDITIDNNLDYRRIIIDKHKGIG